MPFTGGSEAHNKSESARRNVALIGVRYDGGIEQCSGFQRVFAGEKSADEQLARAAQRTVREYVRLYAGKVLQQSRLNVKVAAIEVSAHCPDFQFHFIFGEGECAAYDCRDTAGARRDERADDHPCALWLEDDLVASEI